MRRSTPNRGSTWGINPYDYPVDIPNWDPLRDHPTHPYWMMQQLDIINLYFAVAILDQPDDPISKWLFNKLGGMPNAGLTAHMVKDAFYPTNYEDWRHRRMLNLSNDYVTEVINNWGPPQTI